MGDQLDHETMQRVVRRAIELDDASDSVADGVDSDALVAAASEFGIATDSVQLALAIERLGPGPESAALDRVIGPRGVAVERHVSYSGDEAFERLDEWLTAGHHLRREFGDGVRGEWRKRGDLAAGMQRRARSIAGGAALGSIRLIVADVSPIDEHRSIIRLRGDRTVIRRTSVGAAGIVGAGTATAAVMLTAPVSAVVIPGVALIGATGAMTRHGSTKLDRELVRLLDQLEAGTRPNTLRRGIRRKISSVTDRPPTPSRPQP